MLNGGWSPRNREDRGSASFYLKGLTLPPEKKCFEGGGDKRREFRAEAGHRKKLSIHGVGGGPGMDVPASIQRPLSQEREDNAGRGDRVHDASRNTLMQSYSSMGERRKSSRRMSPLPGGNQEKLARSTTTSIKGGGCSRWGDRKPSPLREPSFRGGKTLGNCSHPRHVDWGRKCPIGKEPVVAEHFGGGLKKPLPFGGLVESHRAPSQKTGWERKGLKRNGGKQTASCWRMALCWCLFSD